MMTLAKQRRAEVDRSRHFFRKPQSSEDRKAQLDKLKHKFPCAQCRQVGHWKDDDDCPAKVKVVNWRKPTSFQFLQSLATSLTHKRERCNHKLLEPLAKQPALARSKNRTNLQRRFGVAFRTRLIWIHRRPVSSSCLALVRRWLVQAPRRMCWISPPSFSQPYFRRWACSILRSTPMRSR